VSTCVHGLWRNWCKNWRKPATPRPAPRGVRRSDNDGVQSPLATRVSGRRQGNRPLPQRRSRTALTARSSRFRAEWLVAAGTSGAAAAVGEQHEADYHDECDDRGRDPAAVTGRPLCFRLCVHTNKYGDAGLVDVCAPTDWTTDWAVSHKTGPATPLVGPRREGAARHPLTQPPGRPSLAGRAASVAAGPTRRIIAHQGVVAEARRPPCTPSPVSRETD
jgi:hypothetical protein